MISYRGFCWFGQTLVQNGTGACFTAGLTRRVASFFSWEWWVFKMHVTVGYEKKILIVLSLSFLFFFFLTLFAFLLVFVFLWPSDMYVHLRGFWRGCRGTDGTLKGKTDVSLAVSQRPFSDPAPSPSDGHVCDPPASAVINKCYPVYLFDQPNSPFPSNSCLFLRNKSLA